MPFRVSGSAYASFECDAEQLLRFNRELHRQFLENLATETADDHRHRVLGTHSALLAVEDLVLADLRSRCFVLEGRGVVLNLDVGERVRAALVANEHRVALRVVARTRSLWQHAHQSAVAVVAFASRDSFRDDRRLRVLADVDHLRASVRLLLSVDDGDGIELADRVVSLENHTRILPRY